MSAKKTQLDWVDHWRKRYAEIPNIKNIDSKTKGYLKCLSLRGQAYGLIMNERKGV